MSLEMNLSLVAFSAFNLFVKEERAWVSAKGKIEPMGWVASCNMRNMDSGRETWGNKLMTPRSGA